MQEAVIKDVLAPDDGCLHWKHVELPTELNKSHLVGQLLNLHGHNYVT